MEKTENGFSLAKMGDCLKRLRKRGKYTQEQVCDIIKCSLPSYRDWEHGKRAPDTINVIELAKLYGVSCDYILGISDFTNVGNKEINWQTGLSNKAIDCLADLKKQKPIIHNQKYIAEVISFILENGYKGINLFSLIAEYLEIGEAEEYDLVSHRKTGASIEIKGYDISAVRMIEIQNLLHELRIKKQADNVEQSGRRGQ